MELVRIAINDQTTALNQEGFKSVLIVDFNQDKTIASANDATGITGDLAIAVSRYIGNGATQVYVAGKDFSSGVTAGDVVTFMNGLQEEQSFYGIVPIFASTHESDILDDLQTYALASEKLILPAFDATDVATAGTLFDNRNSDRIVAFANKKGASGEPHETYEGTNGAVAGNCFPKAEGSLTWGNQKVTDVPVSGWTDAEQSQLLAKNINYICEVQGVVVTQFGRTLSGSNADITRSIDWLKARTIENVTSVLINNDKIPYRKAGFAMIEQAISQAGTQGITQGMLDKYYVEIPNEADIPQTDKANRVLRNVTFTVFLTGAIEGIDITIDVQL